MKSKEIKVGLVFKNDAFEKMIAALLSLPSNLRPYYFSAGEVNGRGTKENNLISYTEKFQAFIKKNPAGFFLKGNDFKYNISLYSKFPIKCDGYLKVDPQLIPTLLQHMATIKPLFGYACYFEELELRNQIESRYTTPSGAIGRWLCFYGRDSAKYIPGLYWMTLIPQTLADLHDVNIRTLAKHALEHVVLDGDQHLFRFYEKPNDWEANKEKMDQLYASFPGIFSISKLKAQLHKNQTESEQDEITKDWHIRWG